MPEVLTLACPIRGALRATAKGSDGLKPSEEKLRVDAIKYLLGLGYPKENIKIEMTVRRFGSGGRNSFRADLAVLDIPVSQITKNDTDQLLAHAIILAEIKRDNSTFDYVRHTQVEPLLDFASREDCIALYWDDVEQRVFWQDTKSGVRGKRDGPLAMLPSYGHRIELYPLTLTDIKAPDSLLDVFRRIENILHAASVDPEQRYSIMLQLLLAKLFDEHAHEANPNSPLDVQDFTSLKVRADLGLKKFNELLERAVSYYSRHLPRPVDNNLSIAGDTLSEVLRILAPIKIIDTQQGVIQAFYMYFARHLYRWDLAQYFTPVSLTEFIVNILNPQFGEHIKDPACGSADFLTAAFRRGRRTDPNYASCVWGADNSTNAVQVAVLNMLLNGDGKSNIKEEDSLAETPTHLNRYDMLVCNPPFGAKIVERRKVVLMRYVLGYAWEKDELGRFQMTQDLLDKQEAGLLFIEACVKQTKPGGRIGIILPNGYLGNKSAKYQAMREWLLRQCRVASICSFPRFTFKTSGADVSASVIFLEKRHQALARSADTDSYDVNIEMIEKVGWDVGNKRAEAIYKRDPLDGSYIVSDDGELLVDSDFEQALVNIKSSDAAKYFEWMDVKETTGSKGWSVGIERILSEPTCSLDPKRYCKKVSVLREDIEKASYFKLSDLVEIQPEGTSINGQRNKLVTSKEYHYVELQDIGIGEYNHVTLRGWELPARAKHHVEAGDIYVGSIWGSVAKWFYAADDSRNLVVTNGCHRLRMKKDKEEFLPDLVAALCTDAYATQMRSFARGSDGLAEIAPDDMADVLIPELTASVREELLPYVKLLKDGRTGIKAEVYQLIDQQKMLTPVPKKRSSHSVLV